MAPPHRGVALMAAVVGAALLLTLDSPVVTARLRGPPDTLKDRVSEKSLDLGTVPFTMSEAERVNTLRVLQAFAAAMPSLGWIGDDFCRWSYVTCFEANVSLIITSFWVPGTLPEMPGDVDYSMVRLDQIHLFGLRSLIRGTLPSSWGKLRKVRTINLAYTGISGTLPASWSSMEAVEEIVLSNTQITGTLPESWSMIPKLWKVYLEGCSLYGSFPESWVEMPSVERVSLHKNHFCGCLPQSWLTSPIFRVAVDVKHRTANCSTAEACNEMRTTQPGTSTLTTTAATATTTPLTTMTTKPSADTKLMITPHPPAAAQCNVSMCGVCLPGHMGRCGVCIDGYVLTDDWQCMKSASSMKPKPFLMSEAERVNTLKVLQAFSAAMPSLRWSGDDFCSWSGVRCTGANVSMIITRLWVTGTLPEMPDDVDYSTVRLDQIHLFGQHSGILGTLPSSWGKLRNVRTINLAYTGIGGTLPTSWSSMEAIEQIILFNTEISGTLPEAWSALLSLRRINLQGCNLYGSLPESWARMPSLERLALQDNHFCGCVPESWLSSPTLVMGVDARHRMADCATAEACTEIGSTQSTTRNSSTTTTAEPTTRPPTLSNMTTAPSTTPKAQCNLFKLKRCPSETEKWCMVCASP